MKAITTIRVNHKIDGMDVIGRQLVCRGSMTKDGNIYEYIKVFKMGKNCPDVPNGASGLPVINRWGKLVGWSDD